MTDNSTKVQQGFRILLPLFSGYVAREIKLVYGKNWWQEILSTLSDQLKDLPDEGDGDWNRLVGSLDTANCIRLFDRKWNDIFRKKLSLDYRTWAKELMGVRNTLSHIGTDDFSDDDAWRALDTMARLCTAFDDEAADEIRGLIREVRYGSAQGSTAVSEASPAVSSTPASNPQGNGPASFPNGLPSWREIMQPHQDVAQGVYKKAEFAADLNQVAKGEGSLEYLDPVEFFGRTYLTEGLKGLLVQALRRVNGKDGEPVIQLKTAFGGGKTHSMLALYHMMRGKVTTAKVPSLKPVIEEAEAPGLPRANVAVLVGTALDPTRTRRPPDMPGVQIYTLWGEMAAQLAASAENPALYEMVREADKKGVSPGSATMKELFDACGPCLILMDELVAYARKLYGAEGLPAGTYGNFITFIQEVTEAARASKNSLVVATIPESKMEIGDESGRIALEAIEHTFGRMESIWKPVAANEGFEVVRRRLFLNCKDEAARDAVCTAFSRMYNENKGDFPTETREEEYRQRMISCYPIHPEVFDRLYEDWATLESFQRTRGVLRFMAAVIHELWMGRDASAMIMPGSVPMNVPNVREELTRYLKSTDERGGMSESWNAIVDREVDGRRSIPWQKDQAVPRFGGKWASRRVARTIFLGSAPTDRSQSVRGLQATRIRLGVIQPGEGIADFNDALNTLTTSLAYLYSSSGGDRFWYDTRPNLRKTMEDRASQVTATDVEYELEKRLKNLKKRSPFMGLHICPGTSLDVADEQSARLVILRPGDTYSSREDEKRSNAIQSAEDILSQRGTSPRIYRNMLAFVAPDKDALGSLQQEVRRYIAWESIQDQRVELNLDAAQNLETASNLKRSDETVELQIRETWRWLLVPYIDRARDIRTITWEILNISGGDADMVEKAANAMLQSESVVVKLAPISLLMELENTYWTNRDSISVKDLWNDLCCYCYLPRLMNYSVLEDAVKTGVNSTEFFALAAGKGTSGDTERYLDLKYNQSVHYLDPTTLIVKIDTARKQLLAEQKETNSGGIPFGVSGGQGTAAVTSGSGSYSDGNGTMASGGCGQAGTGTSGGATVEQPKDTRFYLSAPLSTVRIGRDVQKIMDEIITHLTTLDGCKVEISLEVNAESADGFPPQTVRIVSENSRVLKIDNFGFEK